MQRRLRRSLLILIALPLFALGVWALWGEFQPERERELRVQAHDRLEEWFPEAMELPDELRGFVPRSQRYPEGAPPDAILLHGLDEPGNIWDELVVALDGAAFNPWEFRYPNDQAIDRSTDLLAEYWETLEFDRPVVLVGHSMGGLVIRDFVTRWRHPAEAEPRVEGPPVAGVILIATPNHGSEWARLRMWLELREWFADIREERFSVFAGLRDGTGAAKIDLRPDSRFLADLNERPWPDDLPVRLIGGVLAEPPPEMEEGLIELGRQVDAPEVPRRIARWLEETGEGLGDGVVPVESLRLEGQPDPLILEGSHRGLLVPTPVTDEPPAIEPVLEILDDWRGAPDDARALAGLDRARLVWDITNERPEHLIARISIIEKTLESLDAQGVKPDMILSFRDAATALLVTGDDHLPLEDATAAGHVRDRLERLAAQSGVRVKADAASLRDRDLDPEDLPDFIRPVDRAPITMLRWRTEGYTVLDATY